MPSEPTLAATSNSPDSGPPNGRGPEFLLQRILGKNVNDFDLPESVEHSADRLLRTYDSKPALAEWAYLLRHEIYDVFQETRRGLVTDAPSSEQSQDGNGTEK